MMIGQASFLVSAFVINFGLARLFGPEDYGTYGVVMSVLIVVELFVITGIPELIQKFGGEEPEKMYLLKRKTLPWQIIYSFLIFAVFWFCVPMISTSFGDGHLTKFIRIASFDIVFYGLFKYYQGLQNGLHKFDRHAALGITYAISKVAAIFGFVFSGYSLNGALIGNALGSVGGLIAGLIATRLPKQTGDLQGIPYFKFIVPNILYFVSLYLFFCIDLWFVKIYTTGTDVGYYVSAGALAKIPYVFSIALSAALLPSIAKATKMKDEKQVKELTGESTRYVLMFLILFVVVVNRTSVAVVRLLFGRAYEGAAQPLSILIFGLSFITIFAILNTILQSRNRMTLSFVLMFGLVILDIITNYFFVPRYGILGAAAATTLASGVGALLGWYFVNLEITSFLPSVSLLKMVGSAIIVFTVSALLPFPDSLVFLKIFILSGVYFVSLWLIGEMKQADLLRLKSMVSKS